MSRIRTLADSISSRPGRAAVAVALILNASAAFAEGDRATGRQLTEQALHAQAYIYDEPQDDTVLTADERTMLRAIATDMRRSGKDMQTQGDFVAAAALDLISTAGMVSRRRADADAMLRMVLTFTAPVVDHDARMASFRDIGLPLRLDVKSHSIKFETI